MKMYKAVSALCIFGAIGSAQSVQMTPHIQSLLDEKARKIEELDKCDSKRKAFVIAGISTLGLTAVGVGGNIALANKNKKLDAELSGKKSELASKKIELSQLQYAEVMQLAQELQSSSDANAVIIAQETTKEAQPGAVAKVKQPGAGVDKPKGDDTGVTLVVKNADGVVISNFDVKCSGGDQSQQVHASNVSKATLDSRLPDDANCEISSTGYTTKTITVTEIKKAKGVVVLERTKTAVAQCSESETTDDKSASACKPDVVKFEQIPGKLNTGDTSRELIIREKEVDWSILNGDDNTYGMSQQEFCNSLSKKGDVKGVIYAEHGNAVLMQQRAVSNRYWCNSLGGAWKIGDIVKGKDVAWECSGVPKAACEQPKDNKLCTDSGGAYVSGKCRCPNNNMALSADSKTCKCTKGAFNEKTKRCDVVQKDISTVEAELAIVDRKSKWIMGSEELDTEDVVPAKAAETTEKPKKETEQNTPVHPTKGDYAPGSGLVVDMDSVPVEMPKKATVKPKEQPAEQTSNKLSEDEVRELEEYSRDFENKIKALENGTAEGYIYFLVKDSVTNQPIKTSNIICNYSIDNGTDVSYGSTMVDCVLGTYGQGAQCYIKDLPDEAICTISSQGYRSQNATVGELKRFGGVVLDQR